MEVCGSEKKLSICNAERTCQRVNQTRAGSAIRAKMDQNWQHDKRKKMTRVFFVSVSDEQGST